MNPEKQLIDDLIKQVDEGCNFQTAKFELVSFKFYGDEKQRYSEVLNKTREFLNKTRVGESKAQAILEEWKSMLIERLISQERR